MVANIVRSIALAAALAVAAPVGAVPRIWQLQGVTFEDGTAVSGTFTYDDAIDVVSSWWIRVKGGANMLPFTYVPGNSIAFADHGIPANPAIGTLVFRSADAGPPNGARDFRITPVEVLDGTPSTVAVDTGAYAHGEVSLECFNCGGTRLVAGGSLVAVMLLPPVALVDVVEFYHEGLDHYVMSADAAEIDGLDTGFFAGWVRTGHSFKAYATGSSASGSMNPVCRYWGRPEFGLATHFYSGSAYECFQLNYLFGAAWQIETDNAFQIALPDYNTGACQAGTIPVYRTFNGRTDVNHRYTTSLAVRATMEAAGWVREGYGPEAVIMCAVGS